MNIFKTKIVIALISINLLYSTNCISQNKKFELEILENNDENDEKVVRLGYLIDSLIYSNNLKGYKNTMHFEAFLEKVNVENNLNEKDPEKINDYKKGLKKGLNNIPQNIIEEVNAGAIYDFISYSYNDYTKSYHMLFRFYGSDTGVNYHDYEVVKDKNSDTFQFSDIYIYLSGENMSQTLSRVIKAGNKNDNTSGLSKNFLYFFSATKLYKIGQYEKAYKKLLKVKYPLSEEKFFLIFKSQIAAEISLESYEKSIKQLINTFPDDPTIYLNKIDYYLLKEQYFDAIQHLDLLQTATEDDFLNYLKGTIAFMDENYAMALENLKYTIDNYPNFFEGQDSYMVLLITMKKNEEAIANLYKLSEFYEKEDLIDYFEELDDNGENLFEDFIKTKAYKKWKRKG